MINKNTKRSHDMTTLSQKKLFLFDIDGTIAVGNDLLDGTLELL